MRSARSGAEGAVCVAHAHRALGIQKVTGRIDYGAAGVAIRLVAVVALPTALGMV